MVSVRENSTSDGSWHLDLVDSTTGGAAAVVCMDAVFLTDLVQHFNFFQGFWSRTGLKRLIRGRAPSSQSMSP